MLDASESLPGLSLPMDVAYYRVPGQQSDMDSGCADRSLASFAESMEQSMEAPSPTSAGLSAVQYFAHTAGPPAALSTEPMLQVSMHGSMIFNSSHDVSQRDATSARCCISGSCWMEVNRQPDLPRDDAWLLNVGCAFAYELSESQRATRNFHYKQWPNLLDEFEPSWAAVARSAEADATASSTNSTL
eukprot:CAMPEP_0169303880 /NCGR_PEP_ID=MMETSP1016-20121227/69592_1 /TAXON_ID=342587 /ORGANISM="Karlodinium micrum, Strain CCMP2283" /LENGTH=187 /DNA_ID=CAMNT_0009396733 /DNA_START=30 /DNA_END=594 /DNA_ORIENTATION=-